MILVSKQKSLKKKAYIFSKINEQQTIKRAAFEDVLKQRKPVLERVAMAPPVEIQIYKPMTSAIGNTEQDIENFIENYDELRTKLVTDKFLGKKLSFIDEMILNTLNSLLDKVLIAEEPADFKDAVKSMNEIKRHLRLKHIRSWRR